MEESEDIEECSRLAVELTRAELAEGLAESEEAGVQDYEDGAMGDL